METFSGESTEGSSRRVNPVQLINLDDDHPKSESWARIKTGRSVQSLVGDVRILGKTLVVHVRQCARILVPTPSRPKRWHGNCDLVGLEHLKRLPLNFNRQAV